MDNKEQKLELKHLAVYLSYDLHVHTNYHEFSKGWFDNKFTCSVLSDWLIQRCGLKPILRPLYNLTKEELRSNGFWHHIDYLTHEKQDPLKAPYDMVQFLLSKHYDVFGLIEKGLAINLNDLQK